ncbi:hypothetical protein I6G56_26845 [Burkholderia humptydooensis]|uniref:Uncharacterized protein n=2 Tax=Burkholderia humptydooensis TaxID=430531 RepID=A0A7U4PBE2_9BURK|nr:MULTISPECIES: hypothetical protein [Burkholderia]AJY38376.1 hypothetical protein BW21_4754 [Burkholderia sp. 2002721687]ALX46453.1 hypothetical protein AQ610_29330 [Burkholderia humptydooensis]EIP85886.1 hypothetical protein A33K_16976 [Burkholderia humptydooensis MSMB43]QPS45761.1 hypothetical protein I6G56_26845 [Burkholderia humptydooensis]
MKITDDMLTEMEPIVSQWIRERGTSMDGASYAAALELAAYVAARRTTPDRDAGLEDAAVLMEQRAAEIEACGNMTAHTMALIYRDEAEKIRALKTTPTAASREEGNG